MCLLKCFSFFLEVCKGSEGSTNLREILEILEIPECKIPPRNDPSCRDRLVLEPQTDHAKS